MALSQLNPAQILGKIRYDTLTKKGSVLDVVQLVTGCTQKHASRELASVLDSFPDIRQKMADMKFEGYKQKPTKAAYLATLIEIAWLCPGKHAKDFRRTGAVTLCRALGGDLSLVDEIRRKHGEVTEEEQAALLAGTGVTAAEANGQAVVRVVVSAAEQERRCKLENDMLEAEAAKRREEAAKMREENAKAAVATYRSLLELGTEADDERDRLYLHDAARNYMQLRFPAASHQLLLEEGPANEPLTISEVAKEMGVSLKRGSESRIGRVLAQLFRAEYGTDPPKHSQYVDGAVRKVNSYFTKDRPMVEEAIRQVTG